MSEWGSWEAGALHAQIAHMCVHVLIKLAGTMCA